MTPAVFCENRIELVINDLLGSGVRERDFCDSIEIVVIVSDGVAVGIGYGPDAICCIVRKYGRGACKCTEHVRDEAILVICERRGLSESVSDGRKLARTIVTEVRDLTRRIGSRRREVLRVI